MSTQTVRPTDGPPADKRRTQAIAGALAGVVVVIVLVAVFFGVRSSGTSDQPAAAPAANAASAEPTTEPAAEPTDEPSAAAVAPPAAVDTPAALSKQPEVKAGTGTVNKLTVTPLVQGTGPVVKAGQTITVNYVVITYKDGKLVDSSWKTGQPFSTPIGTGALIKGWDEAIPGQKVGSRLQIDVPAALAYGKQQGDLRFVVDILGAK